MLPIAIVFTLSYVVFSFYLFALSAHGPGSLAVIAPIYLAVSITLLWSGYFFLGSQSYKNKTLLFFLISLGLAGSAFLVAFATISYSEKLHKKLVTHTKVWNVHDELLVTKNGNPIGIRIKFSIRFPKTGYYSPFPYLIPNDEGFHGISLQVIASRATEPTSYASEANKTDEREQDLPVKYEKNKIYNLVFDLTPSFIVQNKAKTKYCIAYPNPETWSPSYESFEKLIQSEKKTWFRIDIWDTPYGNTYYGGKIELTEKEYSFKDFYQGVLKERPEKCDPDLNINF